MRSSYVMAIVPPAERPAAASITEMPRRLASALRPSLPGHLLGASSFGWLLLIARTTKIVYAFILLAQLGLVRPSGDPSAPPSTEAGIGSGASLHRGALHGLASAALFALSTPIAKAIVGAVRRGNARQLHACGAGESLRKGRAQSEGLPC